MTLMNKACWERGCPCYDARDGDEYVEVVEKKEWVGLTEAEIDEICLGDEAKVRTALELIKEKNT